MTRRRIAATALLALATSTLPASGAGEGIGPECSAPTRNVDAGTAVVGLSYGPIAVPGGTRVELHCFLMRGDEVLLAAESDLYGSVGFAAAPGVVPARRAEELTLCRWAAWTTVGGGVGGTFEECWPIVV